MIKQLGVRSPRNLPRIPRRRLRERSLYSSNQLCRYSVRQDCWLMEVRPDHECCRWHTTVHSGCPTSRSQLLPCHHQQRVSSDGPAPTSPADAPLAQRSVIRSEEHTSELQSLRHLVC